MSRHSGDLKNAACLSLFFALLSVVSPIVAFGQDKEPVMIDLDSCVSFVHTTTYSKFQSKDLYLVPAGKRLVIEQVFFEILQESTTAKPQVKLGTISNSGTTYIPLQLKYSTDYLGRTVYTADQPIKLYISSALVNPYVFFLAHVGTSQYTNISCPSVVISGYLENVP